MYAWFHSAPSEDALKDWLKQELDVEYKGLGFYLTDKDALLITQQSQSGEQGHQTVDIRDSRFAVYVFNEPIERTVFGPPTRVASDLRR